MGYATGALLLEFMRAELGKVGAPEDLVQILSQPVTKDATQQLMRAADLVVATGSQSNVRAAYSSGKPAFGVGLGNSFVDVANEAPHVIFCGLRNHLKRVLVVARRAVHPLFRHQRTTDDFKYRVHRASLTSRRETAAVERASVLQLRMS